MSFIQKLTQKAGPMVNKHGDKIAKGVDVAGRAIDKKTKGKYSGQIRTGTAKVRETIAKQQRGH